MLDRGADVGMPEKALSALSIVPFAIADFIFRCQILLNPLTVYDIPCRGGKMQPPDRARDLSDPFYSDSQSVWPVDDDALASLRNRNVYAVILNLSQPHAQDIGSPQSGDQFEVHVGCNLLTCVFFESEIFPVFDISVPGFLFESFHSLARIRLHHTPKRTNRYEY